MTPVDDDRFDPGKRLSNPLSAFAEPNLKLTHDPPRMGQQLWPPDASRLRRERFRVTVNSPEYFPMGNTGLPDIVELPSSKIYKIGEILLVEGVPGAFVIALPSISIDILGTSSSASAATFYECE